ncbi:MAG: hypothetical protein NZT61_05830 [Deltaproteobacteria bacterium]|nr:hypothetical protein [Deltaproteobacteria bacterium]
MAHLANGKSPEKKVSLEISKEMLKSARITSVSKYPKWCPHIAISMVTERKKSIGVILPLPTLDNNHFAGEYFRIQNPNDGLGRLLTRKELTLLLGLLQYVLKRKLLGKHVAKVDKEDLEVLVEAVFEFSNSTMSPDYNQRSIIKQFVRAICEMHAKLSFY